MEEFFQLNWQEMIQSGNYNNVHTTITEKSLRFYDEAIPKNPRLVEIPKQMHTSTVFGLFREKNLKPLGHKALLFLGATQPEEQLNGLIVALKAKVTSGMNDSFLYLSSRDKIRVLGATSNDMWSKGTRFLVDLDI